MRILCYLMVLLISGPAFGFSFTKTFTEAELQAQLMAHMPIERRLFLFNVLIDEPKLDLLATSDRFLIGTKVSVLVSPKLTQHGTAEISGSIDYRPETGSFYISDAKVESLDINGLKKNVQKQIKDFAQIIIVEALSRYPVYTLQDQDVRQKLAKSSIKSIDIENEKVVVKLGMF